jgi:hypothetical protein
MSLRIVFEKGSCYVKPGGPQTPDPFASASQVIGLQGCAVVAFVFPHSDLST